MLLPHLGQAQIILTSPDHSSGCGGLLFKVTIQVCLPLHFLFLLPQHISVSMVSSAADPEPPTQLLRDLSTKVSHNRFVIPAEEVLKLKEEAGCSMDTLLLSFLDEAAHDARPPVSNYKVG